MAPSPHGRLVKGPLAARRAVARAPVVRGADSRIAKSAAPPALVRSVLNLAIAARTRPLPTGRKVDFAAMVRRQSLELPHAARRFGGIEAFDYVRTRRTSLVTSTREIPVPASLRSRVLRAPASLSEIFDTIFSAPGPLPLAMFPHHAHRDGEERGARGLPSRTVLGLLPVTDPLSLFVEDPPDAVIAAREGDRPRPKPKDWRKEPPRVPLDVSATFAFARFHRVAATDLGPLAIRLGGESAAQYALDLALLRETDACLRGIEDLTPERLAAYGVPAQHRSYKRAHVALSPFGS